MKQRLTAVLLALCLVLSLAACSSGGGGAPSQAQEPSLAASTDAAGESSAPEESSAEEPSEDAVSEDVLNVYGLSAEEFAALKTAIQAHIDSEWDAEESYLSLDNGSSYELGYVCGIIRDELEDRAGADAPQDMRNDEAMETFIQSEIEQTYSSDALSPLWKERTTVLAHAINEWAATQNISYDLYYHIWDELSSAFAAVLAGDDYYLAPLFDIGGE